MRCKQVHFTTMNEGGCPCCRWDLGMYITGSIRVHRFEIKKQNKTKSCQVLGEIIVAHFQVNLG